MMKKACFVTSNKYKADYFARLAGVDIDHDGVDQPEIQSLDLREVAIHKANVAFQELNRPVVVEDTSLEITALGRLPGTFIKWFLDEIGSEKICRLADITTERLATASSVHVYFDGKESVIFEGSLNGRIAMHPVGDAGFGWNPIFIPTGQELSLGEMQQSVFEEHYLKIKPIQQVGTFLRSLK